MGRVISKDTVSPFSRLSRSKAHTSPLLEGALDNEEAGSTSLTTPFSATVTFSESPRKSPNPMNRKLFWWAFCDNSLVRKSLGHLKVPEILMGAL